MSGGTLLLLALGLAVDALAVAIAVSIALGRVSPRQVFRLAFHLGLFQALMPIIGWLGGRTLGGLIHNWDHWIAFGLLTFVGGKALYESLSRKTWEAVQRDPTRGVTLVVLSVACSIDALAVGLSLALLGIDIWYPAVVIGLVCGALSTLGMLLAGRLGAVFGQRIEVLGGVILIGIGVRILAQHLSGG
jgi:putative Mn2+ efflux pump MntP